MKFISNTASFLSKKFDENCPSETREIYVEQYYSDLLEFEINLLTPGEPHRFCIEQVRIRA